MRHFNKCNKYTYWPSTETRRTFCMEVNCSLPRVQQPTTESWNEPDESSAKSHCFRTMHVDCTSLSDSWPLKIAPSVMNYRPSPRNIPEERSSHLLRGACFKEPTTLYISAHWPCHRLHFETSTVPKQIHPLSFSVEITHCVLRATTILSSWPVRHVAPQHTISSNLHSLPHSLHPTYKYSASAVCSHSVRIHTCPLICDTKFQTHAGQTKLHFSYCNC